MILGHRLQTIANMIPQNSRIIADIGSDHALLPLYLVKTGKIDYAVIGELRREPFLRARAAVKTAGLANKISVRSGDGLEVLLPGEVNTVVLAGLGGDVIHSILQQPHAKTFPNYILQPMSRAYKIRLFCAQSGWSIQKETLINENQKYYSILAIQPGEIPYSLSDMELEFGPLILKQKDALAQEYFSYLLAKNERMLHSLRSAKDNIQLEQLVITRVKALEELINGNTA